MCTIELWRSPMYINRSELFIKVMSVLLTSLRDGNVIASSKQGLSSSKLIKLNNKSRTEASKFTRTLKMEPRRKCKMLHINWPICSCLATTTCQFWSAKISCLLNSTCAFTWTKRIMLNNVKAIILCLLVYSIPCSFSKFKTTQNINDNDILHLNSLKLSSTQTGQEGCGFYWEFKEE